MIHKDCFAYKEKDIIKCSALVKLDCDHCSFYKTKQEYDEKVKPLKYKRKGVVI